MNTRGDIRIGFSSMIEHGLYLPDRISSRISAVYLLNVVLHIGKSSFNCSYVLGSINRNSPPSLFKGYIYPKNICHGRRRNSYEPRRAPVTGCFFRLLYNVHCQYFFYFFTCSFFFCCFLLFP